MFEEDFVLTISDDYESSASSDGDAIPRGRKRKGESNKSVPTGKKRKVSDSQPARHSDDDFSENEPGEPDGAFDPQFEFDLGPNSAVDEIEDFDGWGDGVKPAEAKGKKAAVDIDSIIARRLVQQNHEDPANLQAGEGAGSDSGADNNDDDEDDDEAQSESGLEISDFNEDELLATDAFGGNVAADDEGYDEVDRDDREDSESDSGSVASPTAHPDDIDSEQSDAEGSSRTTPSDEDDVDDDEIAKRAAFFAPESHTEKNSNSNSFQTFSLSRPILRALTSLSFSKPTPIQSRTIPVALQGLDIVGSAVTGSGKTAAFLLPILERLLYRPRKIPTTRVAILMPTRELAVQCYNVAVALSRYTDITFAQVVGGFSLREQETMLKKRPDVVIATPGRFIDHMRNSASFTVENVEILVLDEADRMLEDGFADELDEILKTIPRGRQTMLFSATMTESVDKLVRVGMNLPVRISVDAKKSTVSGLVQEFVRLRPGREHMRLATLAILCTKHFHERTIVFFRQKKEAHRIRVVFGLLGLKAGELHGNMSQEQRIAAVNAFRDGKITHLLATDVASRGLDIKNVMSVVNYEAPQSYEIYLHRVGRTARAGRSGQSCTIAAEPDRKIVKAAVKSARSQGAKIVSRLIDAQEADNMHERIENFADDIEEILSEEKQEKALAQTETQILRGENLVKHQEEIMSRPKRTWFESEKDKRAAKERGRAELNDSTTHGVKFVGEKKKLSNKDKKKLDDRKLRTEGRLWKKGKGDADTAAQSAKDKKSGGKRGARKSKPGRK